jgi:hypothetical protein
MYVSHRYAALEEHDSSVSICAGWMDEESEFNSRQGQEIFFHSVNMGSEVHPASYTMCTGGVFPGPKAAGA